MTIELIIDKDVDYVISLIDTHIIDDNQTVLFITEDVSYVERKIMKLGFKAIQVCIRSRIILKDYTMIVYDMLADDIFHQIQAENIIHLIPNIHMVNDYFEYDSMVFIKQYDMTTDDSGSTVTIVPDDTCDDIDAFNKGHINNIKVSISQSTDITIPFALLSIYSLNAVRRINLNYDKLLIMKCC